MSQRRLDLQRVGTIVTIGVGLATLLYFDRKRRGSEGADCGITDDCEDGLQCVNGTCMPPDSTPRA